MLIVIPHYNTSSYRERNLQYTLTHYLKYSDSDIVVVEQYNIFNDTRTNIELLKNSRVTYEEFPCKDDIFRRSVLINIGVNKSDRKENNIMVVDNDCILPSEITQFVDQYMFGFDYFVPFNHINFLNEAHTRQLIREGEFKQYKIKSPMHVNRYNGGCILFTREIFDKVGGFNEELIGWGKEDDVFLTKCKRVGANIGRIKEEVTLLHLFHLPTSTKKYIESEQYIRNCKMLALFKRMTDDEFNEYLIRYYQSDYINKLFDSYDSNGKLDIHCRVYCGTGYIRFDTSAYTILPDENGNVGLEELFKVAYEEDGLKSVEHTIKQIDKHCGKITGKDAEIIDKYRKLIST